MIDTAPAIEYTPEEIRDIVQSGIREISAFVLRDEFVALVDELYGLPHAQRPQFVLEVVLSPEERAKRGVHVPEGLRIQRSNFDDGRPTLFCVSKLVEAAYPWNKVTITFDSELDAFASA
jgi:hypothetical protein